jgi:iron complex transport system ATP-binding protein
MLAARDISVNFNGRDVLRGVSLDLRESEIVALVGPNGAGKTTLIRTLNGTVVPTAGQVMLNERSLRSLTRRDIARSIAVVAQENETKFPVKVSEFVLSGRFVYGRGFGWETDKDVSAAKRALADCDLREFADRLMNELSGGERQRVVLARALASGAEILLLDEPTANLDLAHQAMMFRLVRERCEGGRASAVVITHDLNLTAEFADRVMLLKNGKVFALGAPTEVLTAENIASVFGVNVMLDQNPASGKVRVTAIFN